MITKAQATLLYNLALPWLKNDAVEGDIELLETLRTWPAENQCVLTTTEADQVLRELDELPEYRQNVEFNYEAFYSALRKLRARG